MRLIVFACSHAHRVARRRDLAALTAQQWARKLSEGPAFAPAMTKQMLESEHAMTLDDAIEAEAQAQAICMAHPDFREAFNALVAKRAPRFRGAHKEHPRRMMKLVVLGASGGCGRLLATQAAARGHTVTAVARVSSQLAAPDGVRALRGALDDEGFLREAVRGADAVLSALGLRLPGIAPWSRPEDPGFLDRSTPAVVRAMKAEGVGRAVVISAGGVADSYEAMPAAFKMFIRGSALRHVYPALARMEQTWLESGLDVCIPRPTGLTDEPATGRARVVARVEGRATIPRADVAGWMLDALAAPRFEARTPLLTVTGAP